ncbi:protein rai1 [Moniliophthora roreri MCA 2997]|uniref:Decapping nuclease n=1 Tax=Moniliophthora roreri (strain MCA 2997) TaxID=1381753 RepID=V2XR65_MONRO|nr:protein rai1 [Moniliophthora roreri MCA 2997]
MSESVPQSTTLKYPVLHGPPVKPPPFQQPTPLTSFSYTPEHVQEFADSALRYFAPIPPSLLGNPRGGPSRGLDLGYGYERWVRKPEDRGRIDSLLNAVNMVCERGTGNGEGKLMRLKDVSVVAWRGVITRIMTAPYEERDGWEMNVMVMDGTMYLEEHLTDDKLHEKNNVEERHRRAMYYGYAFESYSTWETPFNDNPAPNKWGGDVNTNVQWCSVVRTKLGDMRMVIGGEVDCVRGKYSGRTDEFVELKTSLTIRGPSDEVKFEKKLLKFYFQSFLLGVPEIVVGFRTPRGQLISTKSYKTIEIPRMVRGKPGGWDPSVCLDWGYRFLRKLKETCEPGGVWRVKFVPGDGAWITQLDRGGEAEVINGEDRYGFLPRSYCK